MTMTLRLAQAIGIEAQTRTSVARRISDATAALGVPDLFDGLHGEYRPRDDEGERLPEDNKRVQTTVEWVLSAVRDALVELCDATAARDFTNATDEARADVVVGERVLVASAPVPYLLWLDHQLESLRLIVERCPALPSSTVWELWEERGVYRSEPIRTTRSVTSAKPITLSEATERHPANVQLASVPEVVGDWTRWKFSGALPVARRETLLRRLAQLRLAITVARARANEASAQRPAVGEAVMGYLFAE
jgi:hypothetical protein